MLGKRLLTKPTLGVELETGCAAVVPAGQVIDIPAAPPEGYRTVDVIFDDKQLMMFVNDLLERSEEFVQDDRGGTINALRATSRRLEQDSALSGNNDLAMLETILERRIADLEREIEAARAAPKTLLNGV